MVGQVSLFLSLYVSLFLVVGVEHWRRWLKYGLGGLWERWVRGWVVFGWAECPFKVFSPPYSQFAMDEPPWALSPPPTASPVVQFSSPFLLQENHSFTGCLYFCFSCSRFVCVFVFFFWKKCGVVCFSGFFVYLFPIKFLGLWVCWRVVWLLGLWDLIYGRFHISVLIVLKSTEFDHEWVGRLGLSWIFWIG